MTRTRAPRPDPAHPLTDEISFQLVLDAFADPVRRSIVAQLAQSDHAMRCGSFDLPVATSTATHHFNVLRESGVIRQYYAGTAKMNVLRIEDLDQRFPGLLDALLQASNEERLSAKT